MIAGVTVGLVALPLAMAFAIASGLTPQAGIYCAIITGFIISALGGSRFQIGGPTGAFVVVVSGIIARYGVDGTGLSAIEELADRLRAKGRTLVICGAPAQPAGAMRKAAFHERLGEENICESVQAALDRAAAIVRPMRSEPANNASIGTNPPSR